MLTILCFLWKNVKTGFQLPAQSVTQYDESWVYKLKNSIERNTTVKHRFVCITEPQFKLPGIETYPFWNEYRALGGCYSRLKLFSPEMKDIFGERFIAIDLDCVITNNIDCILNRQEDFVIHKYTTSERDQRYNGSMILMTAGSRSQVWNTFGSHAPTVINSHRNLVIGTDQAWIRLALGSNEATFTEIDGCYDIKHSPEMKTGLPKNANMIFFSGPRNPQTEYSKHSWIQEHWK